ncbi:AAA family ATPase [Poseidonocella sedimentorum]|nr:MoxR family ATPase [Poseidonocella sedimentorum]
MLREMEAGLIGRADLVERLLIARLAGGHVLIEGAPGLAKTRAVHRLAEALPGRFARIQCTPDLMPTDITGTEVFKPAEATMDFLPGPVFSSLVLVDEINRAPPKVQSALLEAMAEEQVTAGGQSRALPPGFMVVATQNSLEHEGTFPLPEAQLDRFLFHVDVAMPDAETERAILDLVEGERTGQPAPHIGPLSAEALEQMRAAVGAVHLSRALKHFIVSLVMSTREGGALEGRIEHPVSPRGTLSLAAAARARAFLSGRGFALPEDVTALAPDVLAHRLVPTWRARAEGDSARRIIADALAAVAPL